jgi:ABC-type amino acid transport substrate-binding protein
LDTIAKIAATPNPADNPLTPTVADNTISTAALVKQRSKLRVGIRYDAPPLASVNTDGALEGLDVDVAREFARRWLGSPDNVEFVQVTSFSAPLQIERREVDLALGGLSHTKSAEAHADFGLTYMQDGEALLVRTGSYADLPSLAQHNVTYIDNSSLGAINGATAAANITVSLQTAPDYSTAIQQLRDAQTDAVLGRWRRLRVEAVQDPTLTVLQVLNQEPIAIMLPQDDSDWADLVNFTLSALIADGTYASMYQKWFNAPPDPIYPLPNAVDVQLATLPDTIIPRNTVGQLKTNGQVHVGFNAQADPLATLDANGQAVGFEIDLCRELAQRWFQNPDAVQFTALAGSDIPGYLRNQTVDIAVGAIQQTQANERVMDFSVPTYQTGVGIAVLQSAPISDVSALNGRVVGTISGRPDQALLEDVKRARNLNITNVSFPDLSTALEALRGGQVDAVTDDQVTLLALVRTATDIRVLPERLSRIPIGIALPTNNSALRDLVNLTLQAVFADGTYARIYKKWFGVEPESMELWPGAATQGTTLVAPAPTALPTLTPAFSTLEPPTAAPHTPTPAVPAATAKP